jgi:hypothetical protein
VAATCGTSAICSSNAGSAAFIITGRGNGRTARTAIGTRGVRAVIVGAAGIAAPVGRRAERDGSSAARSRWIARACSCDTRDSFTPSSVPICFIVTSP